MGNWMATAVPLTEHQCTHQGEDEKVELIYHACSADDFGVVLDLLPQLCETMRAEHIAKFIEQASKGENNELLQLLHIYQGSLEQNYQVQGGYANAKQQESFDRADIATFLKFIGGVPFFFRPVIRWSIERSCLENFSEIVERSIQEYGIDKCKEVTELWGKFMTKRCMWSFLRIYTLAQPPMSTIIRNQSASYSTLMYLNLHRLQSEGRTFSGISYRGELISATDLITYQLTKSQKTLVEIKSYYSTSKSQAIAELFGGDPNANDKKYPALYVFDFTQTACVTAIDLVKQPIVSKFEDEEEVLLLPYTMFRVVDIKKAGFIDESRCYRWIITLLNVVVPKRNFLSVLWERTDAKSELCENFTLGLYDNKYTKALLNGKFEQP